MTLEEQLIQRDERIKELEEYSATLAALTMSGVRDGAGLIERLAELTASNAQLVKERDEAVAGARRYRLLRSDHDDFSVKIVRATSWEHIYEIELDEAIDAALKEHK